MICIKSACFYEKSALFSHFQAQDVESLAVFADEDLTVADELMAVAYGSSLGGFYTCGVVGRITLHTHRVEEVGGAVLVSHIGVDLDIFGGDGERREGRFARLA